MESEQKEYDIKQYQIDVRLDMVNTALDGESQITGTCCPQNFVWRFYLEIQNGPE